MDERVRERQAAKSVEQHFVRMLTQEFCFSLRIAEEVLKEAQASLLGEGREAKTGQIRVYLSKRKAGHGQPVSKTASQEVVWTVNAGQEDQEVLEKEGRVALRQVRIQRLLDEALEQGGVASQEDLASALNVGVRTIKRDCQQMEAAGIYLATRGNLHGIGRGQTHKAQIIGRWLCGETYDQLMRSTRHSSTSIRRYVQSFLRVVELHREGFESSQIAHLVQSGEALVREYLTVYEENDSPACRTRLEEQLERLQRGETPLDGVKRGVR